MAKSPHCAKATHCSKAALHFKELHIVWVLLQEYVIITSTLEEMRSLKYSLNCRFIHAPLSHMRLCLSLSMLPLKSMKVGDHFDMHLEY